MDYAEQLEQLEIWVDGAIEHWSETVAVYDEPGDRAVLAVLRRLRRKMRELSGEESDD